MFSLQVLSANLYTTYIQTEINHSNEDPLILFPYLISSTSNTFDKITRHETHASYTTVFELCLVFLHFPPFSLSSLSLLLYKYFPLRPSSVYITWYIIKSIYV